MDATSSAPQKGALEQHAALVIRAAIKRELECELRGLLMAARMHGFTLAIVNDQPAVTDQEGA